MAPPVTTRVPQEYKQDDRRPILIGRQSLSGLTTGASGRNSPDETESSSRYQLLKTRDVVYPSFLR
jgi:hypothetical protein